MKKEGYTIVKCTKCDLVFVNPRVADLESVYKNNTDDSHYYSKTAACDKIEFVGRIATLRKYCRRGKLLDVGCSNGTFLKLARKEGWDAYGIDPNEGSIKHCKREGLKVVQGLLSRKSFPKNHFDAIHLSDVIEHVENPLEVLEVCRDLLKPGGHILLTTPNFDSYWARRFQVKPLHHLYYFNTKTLINTVKQAGFVPLRWKPLNRVRDLKTLYISPNIKRGIIERMLSVAFKLIPTRSFCIRLPFNDDLIMLAKTKSP